MSSLLLFIFLSITPWGKDADLSFRKMEAVIQKPKQSFVQNVAKGMIKFHQEVISPADGPRSHFFPSSSAYTSQAIEKHGFIKGFMMGCDRLMRENDDPWLYPVCVGPEGYVLKVDPIP